MNDKPRGPFPMLDNVPIIGQPAPTEYLVGGLGIKTDGTPLQILAQNGGQIGVDTTALLVAVALELKLRDKEIAGLRAMVENLTTVAEEGLSAFTELEKHVAELGGAFPVPPGDGAPAAVPDNGTTRIELDPTELERDYRERVAKCERYSRAQGMEWHMLCNLANVEPALTQDQGQVVLDNLRKLEAYLDAHGGAEWARI